ncbi:MAG: nucleoid occlusion protein [Firmicutes bacterium]|nr:nucleoid occlusion protein [Bacillota bacterium]
MSWVDGTAEKDKIVFVEIDKIEPNPYQPRQSFDEEKIEELARSIKTYGLLQPIIVRNKRGGAGYQLVVGERRYLACKSLGMRKIAAVVKDLTDNAVATVALIENLQREDLNFIEEAEGYARLIDDFGFTQEVLAQRIGKSQSTIANKLRLLKLPDRVKTLLVKEELTERHARALLKLPTREEQEKMVAEIIKRDMNVRQTENRIEEMLKRPVVKDDWGYRKAVVTDLRIFLNTIRQAIYIIRKSGLNPEVIENDLDEHYEIIIKLPKKQKRKKKINQFKNKQTTT